MKIYPKGSKVWIQPSNINLTPQELIKKYEEGFSGVYFDPDEKDKFTECALRTGGFENVEDAGIFFGWADSFSEQLIIPFVHVLEAYPGCWPGRPQIVGNCVARSNANAILGLLVSEVVAGLPDEVTGKIETFPKISELGISNGALAPEPVYWYRKSRTNQTHGWFCEASARVSIENTGAVLRQNYPEVNIDLTTYTKQNIERYGRTPPPENIAKVFANNKIRTAARVSTFDAIRDSLGQGRYIHTCGSEGFSRTRDNNGVSNRQGRWMHAMSIISTDDRPEIKRMYNGPLVLVLNSWGGAWNSGPRDIFDSAKYVPAHKRDLWIALDIVNPNTGNIMIPKGSFWAKWSDFRRRECLAFAGLNGWKMQKIKNWGISLWG